MRMPFGKHRGEDLSDVPTRYLKWVLENVDDIDDDLYAEISDTLSQRTGKRSKQSAQSSYTAPQRYTLLPTNVQREHLRELVSAGRKALAGRYHPDVTGDDGSRMVTANQAADWLERLIDNAVPTEGKRT